MSKYEFLILLVISALLFSCSNCNISDKNELNDQNKVSIETIALEKIGAQYRIIPNISNSYAVCIELLEKKQSSPVMNTRKFFIYNTKDLEVIHEDKLSNFSLQWINDEVVSITRDAGMIKKNNDAEQSQLLYKFNVQQRKKFYK
jgi:uncharacterized protein YcfL